MALLFNKLYCGGNKSATAFVNSLSNDKILDLSKLNAFADDKLNEVPNSTKCYHGSLMLGVKGNRWLKNIWFDRDSNPGSQENCSSTLPLSYWTTCPLAAWYITNTCTWPQVFIPLQMRIQSRFLETDKNCEMFSRCWIRAQSIGCPNVWCQM